MRELLVDGVRVFHAEGPARTTAALLVGVGLRDETFMQVGVTHLVEHLAMGTLPRSHLDSNAGVDVDRTVFHATGRPQEVGAFLESVCRALGDLPLERVEREVGVLLAEDCAGADLTMAAAWAARYGLAGPGLAATRGAGPEALTPEQVLAHARRWFVSGNAAVAVVGPLPEGLRLPLPRGGRPVRTDPPAREQDGPQWVQGPYGGVGLLLEVEDAQDPVAVVAVDVLVDRLQDVARTRHGLSYSVRVEVLAVGGRDLVSVAVDAREGRVSDVAGLVWAELADLAERGPAAGELAHAVGGVLRRTDPADPEVLEAEAPRAASAAVAGARLRPVRELAAQVRGVTAAQVADVLAGARRGALVTVPQGEHLRGRGIAERTWCRVGGELPAGRSYRPNALARLFARGARRQLVLGEEALGLRDADGDQHLIAWDEVVGALPLDGDEGVSVAGRGLCVIDVHRDVFGAGAVADVRSRLAARGLPGAAPAR
ncbi:peptidase M16 family protein [Kineococcus sp. NUM-3379]